MAYICFIASFNFGLIPVLAIHFSSFVIADSEILPHGFDTILTDAYNEVKNDLFRGNFLAVVGRNESDKTLLSLMQKYFEKGNYYNYILTIHNNGRTIGNW